MHVAATPAARCHHSLLRAEPGSRAMRGLGLQARALCSGLLGDWGLCSLLIQTQQLWETQIAFVILLEHVELADEGTATTGGWFHGAY